VAWPQTNRWCATCPRSGRRHASNRDPEPRRGAADAAFDAITTEKGAAVIGSIEATSVRGRSATACARTRRAMRARTRGFFQDYLVGASWRPSYVPVATFAQRTSRCRREWADDRGDRRRRVVTLFAGSLRDRTEPYGRPSWATVLAACVVVRDRRKRRAGVIVSAAQRSRCTGSRGRCWPSDRRPIVTHYAAGPAAAAAGRLANCRRDQLELVGANLGAGESGLPRCRRCWKGGRAAGDADPPCGAPSASTDCTWDGATDEGAQARAIAAGSQGAGRCSRAWVWRPAHGERDITTTLPATMRKALAEGRRRNGRSRKSARYRPFP